MNISIIKNPDIYSYYLESDSIFCDQANVRYEVVPQDHFASVLSKKHFGKKDDDHGNYLVTSDEHFKLLSIKLNHAMKSEDPAVRTALEEKVISILEQAIKQGASDVHFIRDDDIAKIRFRVNGHIDLYQEMIGGECDELLFVMYNVMATTKETTWNTKTPQDANIILDIGEHSYRFRYAHMPIFGRGVGGSSYHAVVRVIYPNAGKQVCTDLAILGLRESEQHLIESMISNPSGLVVVSGVTGSGKSTSLKNYMEFLYYVRYMEKGCFITVEDPVEYVIEGAQQSSVVKSKDDKNLFAEAVRSSMRRDPDVLMIGEIRDAPTGSALAGAVESGHLCLTTVHAGNVVGVLQRLNGLGIGLDKLSTPGFVVGIMNQKLVAKICSHCADDDVNEFGRPVKNQGAGCEQCGYHGIVGRQLIVEQMVPDLQILKMVSEHQWVDIYTYNKSFRSTTEMSQGYSIKDKIYLLCLEGLACYNAFRTGYGAMEEEDENYVFQVHQHQPPKETL